MLGKQRGKTLRYIASLLTILNFKNIIQAPYHFSSLRIMVLPILLRIPCVEMPDKLLERRGA